MFKKFLASLLILAAASAHGASSVIRADNTEGFRSEQNLLLNGGFEANFNYWTASVVTPVIVSTAANVGRGSRSLSEDFSGTGQTLTSSAVTIPAGLYGRNAAASCLFKTAATDLLLQAWDGSAVVGQTTITAGSNFSRTTLNFIMPSSGTIALRVASQSDAAIMYLDDCYLGVATNIVQVSQAQLVGGAVITGCAGFWSTSSSTFADFATQTGCSYATFGACSAPATNIPGVTCANLGPGEYRLEYEGAVFVSSSSATAMYQFYDGTTSARESSEVQNSGGSIITSGFANTIGYTTAPGTKTFSIRAKTNAATAQLGNTAANPGVIRVYKYPSQAETLVNGQLSITDWTSYSPTVQGFTIGAINNVRYRRVGDTLEMQGVITADSPVASRLEVRLPAGLTISSALSGTESAAVGTFTTTNSTANYSYVALAQGGQNFIGVGIKSAAASSQYSFALAAALLVAGGDRISFSVSVPIQGWSSALPVVAMVGGVTSPSSGQESLARGVVNISTCNGSTSSNPGLSLNVGINNCTFVSAGIIDVAFAAGTFSAAPVCTCTTKNNSGLCSEMSTSEPTSTLIRFIARDAGGTASNETIMILCQGAK